MSPLLYPPDKARTVKLLPRMRGPSGMVVTSQANGYRSVAVSTSSQRPLYSILVRPMHALNSAFSWDIGVLQVVVGLANTSSRTSQIWLTSI